jgi:hypothetical protein
VRRGRATRNLGIVALAASAAIAIVVLALMVALARADGDPASDVLLRANVFYPYSGLVSPSLQKTLDAETAAAKRAYFPIKVALIRSAADLGAVPSMFGKPQTYADFLEQELGSQAKQPLLVVMPEGYGVQGLSASTAAVLTSLVRPAGSESDDLARAAITAVAALAVQSGHRIDARTNSSAVANGHRSVTLVLIGLALVAIPAAAVLTAHRARGWSVSSRAAIGRTLSSHGLQAGADLAPEVRPGARAGPAIASGERAAAIQPLLLVGLVLILAGMVWAAVRGLAFYGVAPVQVGYDLDQPPLLIALVGSWLGYRSRRR